MSPPGHTNRSLYSPDPHDSNSNHSEQFAAGESTPTTEHDNHVVPKTKNFKTEYKSKFTPFDQYVYNEVTDSFVKHSIEPNITVNQNRTVSSSKSNQDIAGTDSSYQPAVSISTQGADVFNPSEGNTSDNSHANNEPWYREVVKRNEKANEYRFKSEVGHNSPLMNYNSNNASSSLRVDSPYNVERQIVSPNGTESISIGGDLLTASDARSQSSDPQNESISLQQETKQQFKFTPSDYYKRDHLISHMANNNNFALPKEQSEHSTNHKLNSRQNQVSSSARPASRADARVRSRSQSTRRQPASTTPTSTVSSKCQPAAKSNQTTPTRTVAPRTIVRSQITSSARTATKSPVKNTPLSSRMSSTRPTTASSKTVATLKTTPKEPVKRSPVSSNPVSRTTTPRSTNGTSTLGSRTTPNSAGIKKTATPTTRLTPTSKPTTLRPTNTSAISAGRLPKTNVSAPSTRTSVLSSKNKNVEATKSPANSAAQTNAIKSIKTPKAIAAAKQAGVAAASATAATALVTASASDPVSERISDDPSGHVVTDTSQKIPPNQASTDEPKTQADQEQSTSSLFPPEIPTVNTEGQNQIFSQKETGNMLSDELAQAERESINKVETESSEQQVGSAEKNTDYNFNRQNSNGTEKINELLSSNELVNGLAGGLVSAEDRFDSSEKEISSELSANTRQLSSDNDLFDHHDADEPYSIMPTTTHLIEADKQLFGDIGTSTDAHQNEESNPAGNLDKNVELEEPQNIVDLRDSEKDKLESVISHEPKTYDVTDLHTSQSSASLSSKESSGGTDNLHQLESKPKETPREMFEVYENNPKVDGGEGARLESAFDGITLQPENSSEPNEDQEISLSPSETKLDRKSHSNDNRDENDINIEYTSLNDNLNEEIVSTLDNEKKFVENNNTIGEVDDGDFPALVEDDEQKELSSPKKHNSTEPQKSGGEKNYDDLKESDHLNESTPALTSANTTLVEDLNTSASLEDNPIAEVQNNNNDSKNTNPNLVHEALDDIKTNSLDDIANKQTQHDELAELQQSESNYALDIDSDELEANTNRNELLMNVSDLIENESKKKLEMARKSEIARKNLSPQPPLSQSEILLSADQLTGRSNELPNESIKHESDMQVSELRQHEFETEELRQRDNGSDSSEKSSLIIENIPANSTNLESPTKKNLKNDNKEPVGYGDQLEETSDKEVDNSESEKYIVSAFKTVETKEMNVNSVSEGLSEFNINDDIDNDEQLKLSNPLTNSDDELILQPRNYNYSSPRYNEGIGLEMMAQEEDRLNGSVELGDGSSAAIELPTVAENRIEMSASKSIVPEISQTNYLFSRTEDSDEELVDVLDSEKDLIDAEATIGHTTNIDKDELLRFNEVKEKVLENSNSGDTNDAQVQEIISASSVERGLDELSRNFSILAEPTQVTPDVIDDTVKQLQEHGELYRQLNKSQEERRLSTTLEEHVLKRQHSSNSSTSSSAPSEKVQDGNGKRDHDEIIISRPVADTINSKSENNNTTLSSDTNPQDEPVQRNQTESETAQAATLFD